MAFRKKTDRGLVVAVITSTSFADTSAIALKIAQAFAGERSAVKSGS